MFPFIFSLFCRGYAVDFIISCFFRPVKMKFGLSQADGNVFPAYPSRSNFLAWEARGTLFVTFSFVCERESNQREARPVGSGAPHRKRPALGSRPSLWFDFFCEARLCPRSPAVRNRKDVRKPVRGVNRARSFRRFDRYLRSTEWSCAELSAVLCHCAGGRSRPNAGGKKE